MANPKPKKKVIENGKTKINLRLPADLDVWVRHYVEDKNTSLSQLIVTFLTELRTKTEAERVEQF